MKILTNGLGCVHSWLNPCRLNLMPSTTALKISIDKSRIINLIVVSQFVLLLLLLLLDCKYKNEVFHLFFLENK